MSKNIFRKNWINRKPLTVKKPALNFWKNFSKDKKEKDDELDIEDSYKVRKGVLHDKQQSVQEESYFHKEEVEQLKEIKKKGIKKKMGDDKKKK